MHAAAQRLKEGVVAGEPSPDRPGHDIGDPQQRLVLAEAVFDSKRGSLGQVQPRVPDAVDVPLVQVGLPGLGDESVDTDAVQFNDQSLQAQRAPASSAAQACRR